METAMCAVVWLSVLLSGMCWMSSTVLWLVRKSQWLCFPPWLLRGVTFRAFVPVCIILLNLLPLKSGYLWNLQVKLQPIVNLLPDKGRLMDFLLQRRECKMVILSVCSQSKWVNLPNRSDQSIRPVLPSTFQWEVSHLLCPVCSWSPHSSLQGWIIAAPGKATKRKNAL